MDLSISTSSRVKILVVDDHPHTAELLARSLSQLGTGVEVVSATSSHQALKCIQEDTVDILITDMNMSGMTGLELIEKLHEHAAGRPTFSFLITASHMPGLKIEARRLNVREVLYKPVHPQKVCQLVRQALEEMEQSKFCPAPNPQKIKILIADDEPAHVILLSRFMESEGYAYSTARDGLEALREIRSEFPDLILLDVNMPRKDGLTVLQEIRSDPAIQHIPVILLSAAWLNTAEIRQGLKLGADDYLTKPIDRRELLARIRTKLNAKETQEVTRFH